jgi:Mitochondrial import 2
MSSLNSLSFPPLPTQDIPQDFPSPTSLSSAVHISASSTASTTSTDEDEELERQWAENLNQITLLFNLVLLPLVGKYFGRRFAYFSIPFCYLVNSSLGTMDGI